MAFYHIVHFWLRPDLSAAERARFVAGVRALAHSPHVQQVRVGLPAGTPRPVVDNTWDVQLLVVFSDSAAHDRYQSDNPVHQQFIDTFRTFWTKVLIYDSVEAPA